MDTMLTDGVSRQKTEFPAKKPGLMEFIQNGQQYGNIEIPAYWESRGWKLSLFPLSIELS